MAGSLKGEGAGSLGPWPAAAACSGGCTKPQIAQYPAQRFQARPPLMLPCRRCLAGWLRCAHTRADTHSPSACRGSAAGHRRSAADTASAAVITQHQQEQQDARERVGDGCTRKAPCL